MKTRLTTDQAKAFGERIGPMLRFLLMCRRRLDTGGYHPKSKIYELVERAHDAIFSLHFELHYQSIPHGVGRPPIDDAADETTQAAGPPK